MREGDTTQAHNQKWQRRFFAFFGAQAVSLIGSNIAQFAITWWLARSLDSATVLATATLMALLPGVLLGPLAGVLVDRWPRRLIIMMADGVGALGAAVLMLLFWTDAIQVWHIYVITFVRALAGTFHFAAVQSSTTLMVPPEQLSRVGGMNQTVQGINMLVAPPAGALLLELLSLEGMMAIDVVTALIAIGMVFTITIPQPLASMTQTARPSILSDLRTGFLYIWNWPALFIALLMSSVINFLMSPAFALLPILVLRHFKGNALQLASLSTALGVGFVAGGLILSAWGGFKRRIYTAVLGLAATSVGTLLIGIAPAEGFWIAVVGLALFGIFNTISNGSFFAIMQAVVAPEMQGRFFTVLMSMSQGMTPLGLLIAGPVADRYGVQIWYLVSTVCILAMSTVVLLTPAMMNMEDHQAPQVEVAPAE
ncbi:MAG: MFS transporter [Caldilineaceae bacterium]|nr:MFS transporter [Caldilineaceae bacterium]